MKKKVISLLAMLALCLVFAAPAYAASYSRWTPVDFSGQTDFGYFYTYEKDDYSSYPSQKVSYKCFSVVAADGQRFYAAVKESQYEYYRAALANKMVAFKGSYQQTVGDGSPVIVPDNIITTNEKGESVSTPSADFVWASINHGNSTNEIFRKFYEVYSDCTLSIADDSSYIMVDTNPSNADHGTLYAETGLGHITTLNKALGLPDWLYEEMMKTRALDGRQKETFDKVTVSWSYHPNQGLEVIYRKNS